MNNRSETANSAPAGKRLRRSGLAASVFATLVITWMGASIDVLADTILLKSGEEIQGSIIAATRNTVIVRRSIGGMRQMRIQDIDEVRLDLARGEQISGHFLSWADGVYQLRSGDQIVGIREGAILTREPRAEATGQPPQGPPPRSERERTAGMAAAPAPSPPEPSAAPEPERKPRAGMAEASPAEQPAAPAPKQKPMADMAAPAASPPEQSVGPEPEREPVAEMAAAPAAPLPGHPAVPEPEQEQAAEMAVAPATSPPEEPAAPEAEDESQTVAVKGSVEPADPGAAGMVFKIELSRPVDHPVVLIYGTLDDTAKAGRDYESKQGVITLAPGAESGEVHVPLIEHQPAQGERRFGLFLIADPKVAKIVDKRIIATIGGKD